MTVTECVERRIIENKRDIAELERRLSDYKQAIACVTSDEILAYLIHCKDHITNGIEALEKETLKLMLDVNLSRDRVSSITITEPLDWSGKYKARFTVNYASGDCQRYYIDEEVFWMFAPLMRKLTSYGHDLVIDTSRMKGYLS